MPPEVLPDEIRVPIKEAGFKKYRNVNVTVAGMGLFMVLLSLTVCLYSLYRVLSQPDWVWTMNAFGSLWLVLFIGLATIPAWQLAHSQIKAMAQRVPALIVDREGIEDNASNYAVGRIPWSEIESISLASRYAPNIKKTFHGVAFVLKSKDMILRKKHKTISMWMSMDPEITDKRQVFIPQGRLGVPVEEVVAQTNAFRAGIE